MRTGSIRILSLLLCVLTLAGCAQTGAGNNYPYTEGIAIDIVSIEDEAVALSESPAVEIELLTTEAPGTKTQKCSKAVIDYSNINDGYVMVQYTAQTSKKLKAQVTGPTTTYTYNLTVGKWAAFPLSDGNGNYKVTVFENVTDNKYSSVISASFSIELEDEFAPFLRPNQYVDYAEAKNTIAKGLELTEGLEDPLEMVAVVYDYVVSNFKYDKIKAKTVKSGYLPVLDDVLEKKKGICFDYAAVMTAMLRSQGVPCKLVVGYAGKTYHAWINVWSDDEGWIDGAVFFDGQKWQRMDPTFASSNKRSDAIMKYISNEKNYTAKYLY